MRRNGVLLNMFLYTFIYTVLAYIWQGVEWLMIGEIRESDVDTVICLAFAFSVYWNVQHIIEKKQAAVVDAEAVDAEAVDAEAVDAEAVDAEAVEVKDDLAD